MHNRRPWRPWAAWNRATAQPRFPSSKLANSTKVPNVITLALNSSTRFENEGKASAECSCGAGSDRTPLLEVDPYSVVRGWKQMGLRPPFVHRLRRVEILLWVIRKVREAGRSVIGKSRITPGGIGCGLSWVIGRARTRYMRRPSVRRPD